MTDVERLVDISERLTRIEVGFEMFQRNHDITATDFKATVTAAIDGIQKAVKAMPCKEHIEAIEANTRHRKKVEAVQAKINKVASGVAWSLWTGIGVATIGTIILNMVSE